MSVILSILLFIMVVCFFLALQTFVVVYASDVYYKFKDGEKLVGLCMLLICIFAECAILSTSLIIMMFVGGM